MPYEVIIFFTNISIDYGELKTVFVNEIDNNRQPKVAI